MKKLKTEITLQIEEAVAIRPQRVLIAYCHRCCRQVRMIAANEAAMIAGLSVREIFRFVESGKLHFIENQNRLLFVCFMSLGELAGEFDPARQGPR